MRDKVFIDTNVLVYMQPGIDEAKMVTSQQLFETALAENLIVLSTQILQELFVAMTRKLGHDPVTIKKLLGLFTDFEIITINPTIIFEAIDTSVLNQISFWDSLVICAASAGNCKILYTEDLNHGQTINGVLIVNPFM